LIAVFGAYPSGAVLAADGDIADDIASYVAAARALGLSDEDIEIDLADEIRRGRWPDADVNGVVVDRAVVMLNFFA
jgi:hypothetical protein